MALVITIFKANYGDAFLIKELSSGKQFIVDCGFKLTYRQHIKKKTNSVDFIILTHSDEDHINGAFPLLEDYPEYFSLNKVYVNSPESISVPRVAGGISIKQANSLFKLLNEKAVQFEGLTQGEVLEISDDFSLEIISPTSDDLECFHKKFIEEITSDLSDKKETDISSNVATKTITEWAELPDSFLKKSDDIANTSSIAFILNYKDKKVLFLADSHPEVISDYFQQQGFSSEKKAVFDYIKLSHHGSAKSISKRLISMVSCNNYIISTNGGKARSKHPSVETIAKLAILVDRNKNDEINFYFNHSVSAIETRNGSLLSENERLLYKINYIEQNEITLT
ncbi:ComEC/Rec2 family competence protein [Pseudoalteromonas sp. UCD-33C]|uniref:ComEC/Rec2 family competence protein n=1 Tax=Pseudoalteromonas sp. UCD-33C TaxID=1716175 RepID=UPI0006CA188A|nr:MBL fold metallo-hydrolase [Pseudoalteromonas sp. UCD-33C]KPM75845.1 hypothetical protein AOG26_15735 [Pseudoalteromonas sp. UCD-33C]